MPKDSSRPSLPTSSSDFALPPASSPGGASFNSYDEPNLFNRIRRPSLLQRSHHSPLANALSFHARRRSQTLLAEESESEKERMSTDSPSSSENQTPPLKSAEGSEEDLTPAKPKPSKIPLTPPRRRSSAASMDSDMPTIFNRRLNFPLKQPRILKILSEPRPEEDEVKSEAAFQRLLHSSSEVPRTPRPFIDRGRYPEEAGREEETQREGTPSDDELEIDDVPFAYKAPNATQPINIRGMKTPSGSIAGSVNGDDTNMQAETPSSSYGATAMDIDMNFGSPMLNSTPMMTPSTSWRHTPPPTAGTVQRSNKRKLDDSRFDPYPTSSKRRAVSPSLHYFNRDSHSTTNSPIGRPSTSRLPIAIPLNIPPSNSLSSSPTISGTYPTSSYPRLVNNTSSPTMRTVPMLLQASPVIRPIPRRRRTGEERDVEATGDRVNELQLED